MTALHPVDPADEGRHQPGPEEWWNESWYLDFVSEDGRLGGYVRLGLHPNQGVAWWTAFVVGPDRPTVAAIDLGVPLPAPDAMEVEANGTSVSIVVERPLESMRIVASSAAVVHDDPADVYAGKPGTPTTFAIDMVWATDGEPHHYGRTTRYEIPCVVRGTVTVGDEVFALVGQGQRDHSWAPRDWWSMDWCWFAGRLSDGSRLHGADIRILPELRLSFGYVQDAEGGRAIESDLVVTEELGREQLPTTASITCPPVGLDVSVETIAFGPLLFVDGAGRVDRFPRAMARFTAPDGRTGLGWIEWNQVQR